MIQKIQVGRYFVYADDENDEIAEDDCNITTLMNHSARRLPAAFVKACPICRSPKVAPSLIGHSKCGQCSVIFATTEPPNIEVLYENYGLPGSFSDEELDKLTCKRDLMFKKVSGHVPEKLTVLDIGCGWGGFMRHASSRYRCLGIDVGAGVEKAARYGVTFKGNCYDSPFTGFDAAVMNHTLEHTLDPVRVLDWVREKLAYGMLFISVPNFNSLGSTSLGDKWGWLEPNLHRFQFTIPSLSFLLKNTGFKIVEMTTENEPGAYHHPDIVATADKFGINMSDLEKLCLAEEIYCVAKKL